ncbi:MAG: heme A synthase, partial [Sphingobacteriaceae bacterium]
IQAWLGSVVVSSNLVPWIVTVHMLIALVILAISIFTWYKAKHLQFRILLTTNPIITFVTSLALIIDVIQIIFGTEVREKIDEYASKLNGNNRQLWVNGAENLLINHKNLAVGVIVINIILYVLLKNNFKSNSIQRQLMSTSFIIIMFQIFAGVMLSYWGLPPVAQAAHILLASLLFGIQFYLLLNVFKTIEVSGEKYNVG